ncbi:MAG: ATP-binding protein [Opitutales bacterium]|nr:ATP-binding protein [Opitutales bacterium]
MTKKTYTSSLENVERLSQDVEAFFAQQGVSDATIFAINLCLDELFTNSATYGYKGRADGKIEVELSLNGNTAEILLRDFAPEFDPTKSAKEADLTSGIDERKIGGLGIYFCKKNMDEFSYARRGSANEITLKKRI